MKYILLLLSVLLYSSVSAVGQTGDFAGRKSEIETFTELAYTTKEFQRIADLMQLSVNELSDYPVICPVKKPVISSGYGRRKHPVYKVQRFHRGVDFAEVKGTSVYASGNGIVSQKGYDPGYGYFIEIQHAGGFRSFYAHLSKTFVNKGDSVNIGSHIASVGNSGMVTGSHLHYEIRKGKRFLNPLDWCCCLSEVLASRQLTNVPSKIIES